MNNKKALVIDYGGIYCEAAVRFMRDCGSVKYCTFSDAELSGKIGQGLDGVERVESPWGHLDSVDFIFCPDTNSGEIVEYLKRHDYPVAGAGSVEKVEVDRWWARQNVQLKNGLPIQATVRAKGVSALRDVCQYPEKYFEGGIKEFFVKVDNEYRGISESFKHIDFKTSEPRIDYIAYKTGPFKEEVEFICEEMLEGIEPGFDGITFDGEILYPTMAGYEISKKTHVERVYRTPEELPNVYHWIHEGLKPEFAKRKTRFFYSNEMIVDKQNVPFLLDPTMRMASPGGISMQTELIDNFSEVCYGLATGKPVNPVIKYKYAVASPLCTLEAEKGFVNIIFPKEFRQWVKLTQGCKKGSDYYSIPPEIIVATVVALGNTVEETLELCKERIKQVKGNGLSSDESGLMKAMDIIKEGKQQGIQF
jgi:hypothetical protein